MVSNINTVSNINKNTKTQVKTLNPPQKKLITGGVLVSLVLFIYLAITQDVVQPILLIIGLLLGYTLFHSRFGFTSAFRRLMSVGNGEAIRAHMVMLGTATLLFAPILAFGISFFGAEVTGYVSPVGVSLIVGAFIFGIGMQLGNGCASGTLFNIGAGRSVMFITLIFFIIGTTIGAAHLPFWTEDLPSIGSFSLATSTNLGYGGALIVSLLIFGLIAFISKVVERKKNAPKAATVPSTHGWKRVFRGSWPMLVAAVVLAVLNALTLMVRGEPWGLRLLLLYGVLKLQDFLVLMLRVGDIGKVKRLRL